MTITQEEQQILQQLKSKGYSFKDSLSYLGGNRTGRESSISLAQKKLEDPVQKAELIDRLSLSDRLANVGTQTVEQISGAISGTGEYTDQSVIRKGVGATAAGFTAPIRGAMEFLPNGVRTAIGKVGELFKKGFDKVTDTVSDSPLFKEIGELEAQGYINQETTPGLYTLKDALGTAESGGQIADSILLAEGVTSGIKSATEATTKVRQTNELVKAFKDMDSLFPVGKTYKTADEVINAADSTLNALKNTPSAEARMLAEATAPELTLAESWSGLTPDIKGRIQQAGTGLMQEYLDVVKTRNLTDTILDPKTGKPAPAQTAYEHGGDYARRAASKMEEMLNDTGASIGQTRQKLGSVKATIDQVKTIENQFKQGLDELGLQVDVVGNITQKKGAIRQYGSVGDVASLQDIWLELQTLKQSPTLTNLIDFRNFVQRNIKFGKTSQTTSGVVEPFAKNLRYTVKEVANQIVGKTEAVKLEEYSKFMEALNDLKSYTDKRAGGEYLLRLALSGRGGEARAIAETIKRYTGIDLMDHATLMTTVTDMLANSSQKNLFRQEITKSGLDVARILSGDPSGAIPILAKFIQDKFLDPESVLLEAAGQSFNGAKSQTSLVGKILGKDVPNKRGGFVKIGKSDDLIKEAKKYKSAEEFVGAQPKLYHGTSEKFDNFDVKKTQTTNYGDGIYFSDNQKLAEYYSTIKTKSQDLRNAKIEDLANLTTRIGEVKTVGILPNANIKVLKENPTRQMVEQAKKEGFDGVKFKDSIIKEDWDFEILGNKVPEGNTTIIFDPKNVKTKSQLEQIWKEANKSKK